MQYQSSFKRTRNISPSSSCWSGHGAATAALQPLERRMLLTGEPWGPAAQLIHQDLAAASSRHARYTGASQTIAVLDTGINYRLSVLGGGLGTSSKVIAGRDFVDDDTDPMDTDGHGTAVASLIAGRPFTFEGLHYQGIAPNARLVAVRITDHPEDPVPDALMGRALQWVIDHRVTYGITAVNISFGEGLFRTKTSSGPLAAKFQALRDAGVVVVAAAGNAGIAMSGEGVEYPAADRNVIAVGSVDDFDVISEFSQRGPALDLLAPGQDMVAPTLDGSFAVDFDGTSFAAPLVTGAAALLREANPALRPADVLSIFRASGENNRDGDTEFGAVTRRLFPRLDIQAALTLAELRHPNGSGASSKVGGAGSTSDLSMDRDGVLHFAWYDASAHNIRYATRDTSGRWSAAQIVDNSGDDVGHYLSLSLDQTGKPSIAYFDSTDTDLIYANFKAGAWRSSVVDAAGTTGSFASLAFDKKNLPCIAYYKQTGGDLRFARYDGGRWNLTTIDGAASDAGQSTSLALGPDGRFGIAYEDSTSGVLRFAQQATPESTRWFLRTVDQTRRVSFINLAYDGNGRASISYYDAGPADLKFAALKNGQWRHQLIASKGAVGLYDQLVFTPDGEANIFFHDKLGNRLLMARGHFGAWETMQLQTGGGQFISAIRDGRERELIYTWLDPLANRLKFADVPTPV
jgi:hypothetical protein